MGSLNARAIGCKTNLKLKHDVFSVSPYGPLKILGSYNFVKCDTYKKRDQEVLCGYGGQAVHGLSKDLPPKGDKL
jgi:hypothetical protein